MKKLLYGVMFAWLACGTAFASDEDLFVLDTSDPLYVLQRSSFLSVSNIEAGNGGYVSKFDHDYSVLLLGQKFAFGVNDRFNIATNIRYQIGFSHRGHEDEHDLYIKGRGFSAEFDGLYRLGLPDSNSAHITSDVLFGFRLAKNRSLMDYGPEFAKTAYFTGLRFGRQWTGFSLAGTVKSTWIFDGHSGLSYIDVIPEVYFRMINDWRLGIGGVHRVATNSEFNRDWLQGKVIKQYGHTQYVVSYAYELRRSDSTFGFNLNLLF